MSDVSNKAAGYAVSLQNAANALICGKHAEIAAASGGRFLAESCQIEIAVWGRPYRVSCVDGSIAPQGHAVPLDTAESILLLHYLATATGRALTGRSVSFAELPHGGMQYFPAFKKRSIDILCRKFGRDAALFDRACEAMRQDFCNASGIASGSVGSGEPNALPTVERVSMGDASVCIRIFPRVAMTYIVWLGDDELPPSGQVLFDKSISDYLPLEDVAVAAGLGAIKLAIYAKQVS